MAINIGLSSAYRQKGAISKRLMVIGFLIFALIAGAWTYISLGFSSDVKKIGQGKPIVMIMFAYSDDASANLKYGYKKIRGKYEDKVEFLLVNIHSPNGLRFLQHTKVKAGTALHYDGEGNLLLELAGPKDVATLDESVKTTFKL